MASIIADLKFNHLPLLDSQFRQRVNRGVRKQVFVTEGDVKVSVVKYDVIDTGNLLGSVRGEMTGELSGMVSVSAESGDGYPYPWIQNYGSVHIPPRPFFSDPEAKAESEFEPRVRREVLAGL